eukprot:1148898-Pelagomonas_calceolata.AAC.2
MRALPSLVWAPRRRELYFRIACFTRRDCLRTAAAAVAPQQPGGLHGDWQHLVGSASHACMLHTQTCLAGSDACVHAACRAGRPGSTLQCFHRCASCIRMQAIDVSKFTRAPVIGREHDVVFPLTNMLRGIVVNPPDKRPRERSAAATTTGTDSDGTASSAAAPAASASAATGGGSSGGSLAAPSPSPSPAASEAHTPWTKWLAAQQQQQREKQEREQAAAAAAAAAAAQGAVRGPAAPFVQLQRVETVGCEGVQGSIGWVGCVDA